MGSGFYAAFSGWLARSEALDAAASNLANAGTQGFRAEREYFRSALMGPGALGDRYVLLHVEMLFQPAQQARAET